MEKLKNCPCLDKDLLMKSLIEICVKNDYDFGKLKEGIDKSFIGWFSRSVAVAVFIFVKTKDGKVKVLASERGEEAADFQGMWNVPCGYVDFDETTKEAAARELFEECGIKIDPSSLQLIKVQDSPKENHQNITLRYLLWTDETIMRQEFSKKLNEGKEVGEIKWLSMDEVKGKAWAFNHDEIIHDIYNNKKSFKFHNIINKFKKTMKKLVFMFAAMAVLTMASCGQSANGNASANDSDSVSVVDSVDTVAVDSVK